MSIDSGGTIAASTAKEALQIKNDKQIEDEELEDGELDTDDDEPVQVVTPKESKSQQQSKSSNSTSSSANFNSNSTISSFNKQSTSNNKVDHDKSKSSSFHQSHHKQVASARKRRRRSDSDDDSGDTHLDSANSKRNRKTSSTNRTSKSTGSHRPKRMNNSSTDDDSESDDDDMPKIDQKMMFTMMKQMQEILSKQNKTEYDKLFERVKENKGGQKEIMRFFRKNKKWMDQSSHDNQQAAMFNQAFNNATMFQSSNSGVANMFGGMQQSLGGGPPQFGPMGPSMMSPNNFGPPPSFNHQFPGAPGGPPGFNAPQPPPPPGAHMQSNVMQQQIAALNELANRNSPGGPSQSSSNHLLNKKLNKKRKKGKDDKDDHFDDAPKQQLCKYFLEGHCQKGNECDFLHQQPYNYKREVCKFYLQDSCGKGDNCTFLHKEFPCKLFHTGQDCSLAENCKFSHEPINEELREIFINYLDNAELNEELNQAYGLSKLHKKITLLGDVPDNVRSSYRTWVWQQEMKKLEIAYVGTKRNLFCIDDQFIVQEKPPKDGTYDDEEEEAAEFATFNDIDERQSNFFFDTAGNNDDEDLDENMFTKDNDLRKEFSHLNTENSTVDVQTTSANKQEFKSLDEVKKQWLDNESEDEDLDQSAAESKEEEDKKSSIDIGKMLDAIRQTTTSTQSNQTNNTQTSSSDNSEFWKTILNGVNLNDSQNSSGAKDQDERVFNAQLAKPSQTPVQPRDPRLLRQRNSQTNIKSTPQSIQKQLADEPFIWSHGDVSFKLYPADVESINYSIYRTEYESDNSKLKSDPRLQNYFNNQQSVGILSPSLTNTVLSNTSTNINTNINTNIINPNQLAPLTLSQKNEPSSLSIPPPPKSKLSALDLISPSSKPTATLITSQLSFEEQILASVHLPKSKDHSTIAESVGITSLSLSDLVKSKKVNTSEATDT